MCWENFDYFCQGLIESIREVKHLHEDPLKFSETRRIHAKIKVRFSKGSVGHLMSSLRLLMPSYGRIPHAGLYFLLQQRTQFFFKNLGQILHDVWRHVWRLFGCGWLFNSVVGSFHTVEFYC